MVGYAGALEGGSGPKVLADGEVDAASSRPSWCEGAEGSKVRVKSSSQALREWCGKLLLGEVPIADCNPREA